MKKLLLLFFALLTGVSGAWAATVTCYNVNARTNATALTTGTKYMIYNTARRYFLSASGSGYTTTASTTPLSYSTTNANYVWELEEGTTSGTFKIKNIGTNTYSAGGTSIGTAVDYTIAEFSSCLDKGIMPSYNDEGTTTASASITSADNTVYIVQNGTTAYWNGADGQFNTHTAAHVYVLYAVTETSKTTLSSTSDINTSKCYTISTADRGSWLVPNDGTQITSTTNADIAVDKTDIKQQFAFISKNNKWFLYSVSARKFISKRGNFTILSSDPNDDVTLLASSGSTDYPVVVAFQDGTCQAGISNGYNPAVITHYNDLTDAGNRAVIEEVGDFDPTTVQSAITAFLTEPSVTSGNYYRLWNQAGSGSYIKQSTFVTTATQAESVILKLTDTGTTTSVGKKIYSLYDAEASKYLSYTDVAKSTGDNTNRFAWTDNADNSKFVFNSGTGNNNLLIRPAAVADDNYVRPWNSSGGYNLILWDGGDNPSNTGYNKWNITDVTTNVVDVTYKTVYDGTDMHSVSVKTVIGKNTTMPTSLIATIPTGCTYGLDKTTISEANEEVTATVTWNNSVFEISEDFEHAKWYYMTLRGYWALYSTTAPWYFTDTQSKANSAQWAFIGSPYSGFKIINREAGDGLYLHTTGTGETNYPEMSATGTDWLLGTHPVTGYTFYYDTNNHLYAGNKNNQTWLRVLTATLNSTNDANKGGSFTFEAVPDNFNEYVIANVKPYFDATGKYFGLTAAAAVNKASDYSAALTECTQEKYEELLAYVSDLSNIRFPATGYYRLRNNLYPTYYMNASAAPLTGSTDNTGASTIVYLVNDGSNRYTMQMQGAYVQTPAESTQNVLSSTSVTFTPTIGAAGWASFKAGNASKGNLHMNSTKNIVGWDANSISENKASYWAVEDATSFAVTLNSIDNSDYYATLCVPFAVTMPEGVTANTVTVSGTEATPTAVEGTLTAGTPVLLTGNSASATLSIVTGTAPVTSVVTGTGLTGTFTGISSFDGATNYVLGTDDTKVGFFHWDGTALGANRAYIDGSTVNGVKGFYLNWGDEDAISSIVAESQSQKTIYNLAGQRVQKAQKGLYIINGKKVVIK